MYRDMTIYELNKSFKAGLALIYSAGYGTLQYAVKKLLENSLISFHETVENGRNKKIYRITDAGREEFFRWMEAETSLGKLETIALSKVFFLGLIKEKEKQQSIVAELIEKITLMEGQLKRYEEEIEALPLSPEERKTARYQFKTLNYGIMSHGAAREWFEGLLQEMKTEVQR
jgi:DNA-binding PadR family transcriptional regulator